MAKYSAQQIAEWFLAYNRSFEYDQGADEISNLKLQKLLYYAQGTCLGIQKQPLFDDAIEAWQHGPVVPSVYQQYKKFGTSGIEFDGSDVVNDVDKDTQAMLQEVYAVFGQYSAWKLREMIHNETPWQLAWNEDSRHSIISKDSIYKYFLEQYIE